MLNEETLRQLLASTEKGPAGFLHRVYRLYTDNAPKSVANVKTAIAARDFATAGRAAHALKSMSLSIGAERVVAFAESIEKRAGRTPCDLIDDDASHLTEALDEACAAIQRLDAEIAEPAHRSKAEALRAS